MPTARCARRPWFERHGDVDVAVAVLRLDGGALAILSGTRHDPLGYDVRLEVFGTADSIAVGVDDAQPAPLGRARRARTADRATRTSSSGSRRPTGPSSPPSSTPSAHGGRQPVHARSDARAALAVALAADRSRAERRPVAIEEVASAEPSELRIAPHSKWIPT